MWGWLKFRAMRDVGERRLSWPFSICRLLFYCFVPATCGGKENAMEDRKYDLMLSDEAKEAIVMETALKRNTAAFENPLTERLKVYYDRIREFCGAGEYRRYGKYLVKESFEGDATLTQLLTEYIERTATLKY